MDRFSAIPLVWHVNNVTQYGTIVLFNNNLFHLIPESATTRLGGPVAIVPGITHLSLLVGTSSFIVRLRIQNATKTTADPTMQRQKITSSSITNK